LARLAVHSEGVRDAGCSDRQGAEPQGEALHMSDLTDLYDNAIDLLVRLREAESCYAHNDHHALFQEMAHVDPVEVHNAIRDLRELSMRQKALDELGDGTIGSQTAASPKGADASAPREVAPSVPEPHPGFSVKVPCR
jgi:hypothetical protein